MACQLRTTATAAALIACALCVPAVTVAAEMPDQEDVAAAVLAGCNQAWEDSSAADSCELVSMNTVQQALGSQVPGLICSLEARCDDVVNLPFQAPQPVDVPAQPAPVVNQVDLAYEGEDICVSDLRNCGGIFGFTSECNWSC